MIRQPGSKYERTRSKTLLKIKKFHDAEVSEFDAVSLSQVVKMSVLLLEQKHKGIA